MSSRRTLILVVAIVFGAIAAFMTLRYVSGVENESAERNQLVDVLVATAPIAKGESADSGLSTGRIAVEQRRRADLPAAAARRPADIQGQTAAFDMNGGEMITTSMFLAERDLSGSKSMVLDKGNVAVTVSVSGSAGVAGLVQPGDSINILTKVAQPSGESAGGEASLGEVAGTGIIPPEGFVYAFQAVRVLAVGTRLDEPQPAATAPGAADGTAEAAPVDQGDTSLITVQLPPEQALQLAALEGTLHLTLNRPDYEPKPMPWSPILTELPGITGVSPYPKDSTAGGGR